MQTITLLLCLVSADSYQGTSVAMTDDDVCGVVCAYALLQTQGVDATLAQVKAKFDLLSRDPSQRGHSMTDLQKVLGEFGVHVAAVQRTRNSFSRAHTPAILFIRPEHLRGNDLGHFVLLSAIDANQATIADFVKPQPVFSVNMDELTRFWDGEALEIPRSPPSCAMALQGLAFTLMGAAALSLIWKIAVKRRRISLAATILTVDRATRFRFSGSVRTIQRAEE